MHSDVEPVNIWQYEYFMAVASGDMAKVQQFSTSHGVNVRLCPAGDELFESLLFVDVWELLASADLSKEFNRPEIKYDTSSSSIQVPNMQHVGVRPLHVAAGHGQAIVVDFLVSNGADVNAVTPELLLTPLQASLMCKEAKIIPTICSRLVASGAKLDVTDESGSTPLSRAIQLKSFDIVKSLLSAQSYFPDTVAAALKMRDQFENTPLQAAVRFQLVECVEALVKAGADVNFDHNDQHGPIPVISAIRYGNVNMLQVLLSAAGCNVNCSDSSGYTALTYAASFGSTIMVSMLLSSGADPQEGSHNSYPLFIASSEGYVEIIQLLLEVGADVEQLDSNKYTALHFAAWNGKTKAVQALLHHGAMDDSRTEDGNTPLALACHGGHSETAALFISRSCNIHNADRDKDTPLSYCCYNGDLATVKLLIEHGADVTVRNRVNVTSLWNAVFRKHIDVAKYLIAVGNPPLSVASRGMDQHAGGYWAPFIYDTEVTPLYVAIDQSQYDIASILLDSGINPSQEKWFWDYQFTNSKELGFIRKYFVDVQSLLWLTRRVIRNLVGSHVCDKVSQLNIPTTLRHYLLLK